MSIEQPSLERVINFRDLADASPRLCAGRVFRSARLCFATPDDLRTIKQDLGVRTLIDLRTTNEIERGRDPRSPLEVACESGEIKRHAVSVLDPRRLRRAMLGRLPLGARLRVMGAMVTGGRRKALAAISGEINASGLLGLNEILLAGSGVEIVRVLRLVADPANHPLVIHCTAGKDRTGLLSALILAALGIPQAEIVGDYARSHDCFEQLLGDPAYAGGLHDAGLDPTVFLSAHPVIMQQTLDHLTERHGGAQRWMDGAGFGPEERAGLSRVLLS